jgi:hypothetical protein
LVIRMRRCKKTHTHTHTGAGARAVRRNASHGHGMIHFGGRLSLCAKGIVLLHKATGNGMGGGVNW